MQECCQTTHRAVLVYQLRNRPCTPAHGGIFVNLWVEFSNSVLITQCRENMTKAPGSKLNVQLRVS